MNIRIRDCVAGDGCIGYTSQGNGRQGILVVGIEPWCWRVRAGKVVIGDQNIASTVIRNR